MNSFILYIAVPTIISIRKTAIINKANGRIDATNHGAGTVEQSVGFDNTTKRVFARKIIVK